MLKRAISTLLTAAAFLAGTALLAPEASAVTVTSTKKVTLKLAHPNPETHIFHKAALEFKKEVEAKSNGNITVNIFPANQLGGSKEIVQSVSLGAVELNISGSAQFSAFNSDLEALDLPFLFATREDAYRKLDGEAGAYLAKPLEKKNIKVLGYLDGGFRSMFNSQRPLVHPQDFKGLPVRVQDSSVYMDMMSSMGALPTFLPWGDLYVSIQQGIVQAGEAGVAQIYAQRFYEVAKYVSLTNHTFTTNPFVMANNKWKALPGDYQELLMEATRNMVAFERAGIVKDEEEAMKKLKEAGAQINEVDPAEFQAAVAPVRKRYAEKNGQKLIDLLTR